MVPSFRDGRSGAEESATDHPGFCRGAPAPEVCMCCSEGRNKRLFYDLPYLLDPDVLFSLGIFVPVKRRELEHFPLNLKCWEGRDLTSQVSTWPSTWDLIGAQQLFIE